MTTTSLPAAIDHLGNNLAEVELELLTGTAPRSRIMITLGSTSCRSMPW
ncbi:MAG: hypothetical protein R2848_07435 [Thermomicrobiales bacterium]